MKEEKNNKKSIGKGRKALVVFALIFILSGVFLASFTCSFQVMIQAENNNKNDENSIEAENKRLKENIQLLQDRLTILEAEKERGTSSAKPTSSVKPTTGTSSSSASKSTSSTSSAKD